MVEPIGAPARDSAPVDNFGGRGAIAPESPRLASINMLPPEMRDVAQNERGIRIRMDRARDAKLTVFGKATLTDRYLMPGESFQRSEEHTSELQSLMRISYVVFCLKK